MRPTGKFPPPTNSLSFARRHRPFFWHHQTTFFLGEPPLSSPLPPFPEFSKNPKRCFADLLFAGEDSLLTSFFVRGRLVLPKTWIVLFYRPPPPPRVCPPLFSLLEPELSPSPPFRDPRILGESRETSGGKLLPTNVQGGPHINGLQLLFISPTPQGRRGPPVASLLSRLLR